MDLIFRRTQGGHGWVDVITTENSDLNYLRYSRAILDKGESVNRTPDTNEWTLMSLAGECLVHAGSEEYMLRPMDSVYIPCDTAFTITGGECGCDIVAFGATCSRKTRVQLVTWQDVLGDPKLLNKAGSEDTCTRRDIRTTIGDNVDASRLLIGVTKSWPGHWCSWPPHEHASTREEIYLYCGMDSPAFGLQMVYGSAKDSKVYMVEDGDAVVIPEGYHPNAAAPGCSIQFIWAMAGVREDVDREWGDVTFQPGFA